MSHKVHHLTQQQRWKLADIQQREAPHQPALGLAQPRSAHRIASAYEYTQPTLQPLELKRAAAGDTQAAGRLERAKTAADDAYVAASALPYQACCEASALVQRLSEQIEQQMRCNAIMQHELAAANPQAVPALTVPEISRTLSTRKEQLTLNPKSATSVLDLLEHRGLNAPSSIKGALHQIFPRDSLPSTRGAAKAAAAIETLTDADCHLCREELRNGKALHKALCCHRLLHLDCAHAVATRKHTRRQCPYCYDEWAHDSLQRIEQQHAQQKQLEQWQRRQAMLVEQSKRNPSSLLSSRRVLSPSSSSSDDSDDDTPRASALSSAPPAPSRLPHGRRVKAKPIAASSARNTPADFLGGARASADDVSVDSELDQLREAWSDACTLTDDAEDVEDAARSLLPSDHVDPSVLAALQTGSWMELPSQFVQSTAIEADDSEEPFLFDAEDDPSIPSQLRMHPSLSSSADRDSFDLFESKEGDREDGDADGDAPSSNSQNDADDADELPPAPPPPQQKRPVAADYGGLAPMDIDMG